MLDRIRLEINPCRKNGREDALFAISTFDNATDRCLEVTSREVRQVEFLVQHIN